MDLANILQIETEAELRAAIKRAADTIDVISLYNRRRANRLLNQVATAGLGKTFAERLYNFVHERHELETCPVCNSAPRRWSGSFKHGYRQTCGARCGNQNPARLEKIKSTNRARHGVEFPLQVEAFKKKLRSTTRQRYGVDHPSPLSDVKERIWISRHQALWEARSPDILSVAIPRWDTSSFKSVADIVEWQCARCGRIFTDHLLKGRPRCPSCDMMNGLSGGERELFEFIASTADEVPQAGRYILTGADGIKRQVDIYLPGRGLGIEFNGIYWHSLNAGLSKNYHLEKIVAASQLGIRLIHVFEDDWIYRGEIVRSRIRNLLGKIDRKIMARRCVVKSITPAASLDFLNQNHLRGGSAASVHLGLFCDDELVSVMTLGRPRFNKAYDWELIRFASKLNVLVVGDASKLFSYFRKFIAAPGQRVISYSDRCWGEGDLYEMLGFKRVGETRPAVWYHEPRSLVRHSRFKFQKHRLKDLLPSFDLSLTELENMMNNGYLAVFDCGNAVFELSI